jgi:hypothetical protein
MGTTIPSFFFLFFIYYSRYSQRLELSYLIIGPALVASDFVALFDLVQIDVKVTVAFRAARHADYPLQVDAHISKIRYPISGLHPYASSAWNSMLVDSFMRLKRNLDLTEAVTSCVLALGLIYAVSCPDGWEAGRDYRIRF